MSAGLALWLALAAISCVALFFVAAPYGRHAAGAPGPTVESRTGWFVMELPALAGFLGSFGWGLRSGAPVGSLAWLAAGLWVLHYGQRVLVYPFRLRAPRRPMPLVVVLLAFAFNCVNGSLNGRALATAGPAPGLRFGVGVGLFLAGYAVNLWSDEILRRLRRPGEDGYAIPRGGLFRWVSCPNYLGEGVEWSGWALLAGTPAAIAFALWSWANLIPRARSHHRWYREHFPEYPAERKALVPGLW